MPPGRLRLAVAAALVAAVLVVFAPVAGHQFVFWDDDIHIHENPGLRSVSLASTLHFWTTPHQKLYIPVTYTAWSAIAAFVQKSHPESPALYSHPGPFHIANLALHTVNALLAASLLLALLRAASPDRPEDSASHRTQLIAAGLGGCLFALHPLQVEPVAWATGLKDVLCATASLIALRTYVAAASTASRNRRLSFYSLSTVAFAAALLSKPGAVVLPLIAATLDLALLRRPAKSVALALAPWLVLALPAAWMAKSLQPASGIGEVPPLPARLLVAGDTLAFYLGKLVAPIHLAPDYGRTPKAVLATSWSWIAWVFPAAAIAWLVRYARKGPWIAAAAIFGAGILPVLGVVPFQHQKISTVADRYLYLSLIGPALALAWALAQMQGQRFKHACWATGALMLALGVRSAVQVPVWHDTVALFEHTLQVNPSSAPAHNNLGYFLWTSGRGSEAIAHYEAAVRLAPDYGLAHNNLGNTHLQAGRYAEAIAQYQQALTSTNLNDVVDARNNLGLALERLDRFDEAIASYDEAIRAAPYYGNAHFNLGVLLHKRMRTAEAVDELRVAVGLMPDSDKPTMALSLALNDLGYQAASQGNSAEAVRMYQEALSLWPSNLRAHVNLGTARLSAGDLDGAIRDWEAGLRVLPRSPELHYDLAIALLRKGRMEEGKRQLQIALEIAPEHEPSQRLLRQVQ
ncbi:MAG: tetratricopeptide repeat protein [Deltaproteobacteria bacterium]|nr:tetratricopeptide repeat protein [Deltaproteobacteria bacterium]